MFTIGFWLFMLPFILLLVFFYRTSDLPKGVRRLFVTNLVMELPSIAVRTFLGAAVAPFFLLPVWIVGLIVMAPFALSMGVVHVAPIALGFVVITVGLVAFACGFGSAIFAILTMLGLTAGEWFLRWTKSYRPLSMREWWVLNPVFARFPAHIKLPARCYVIPGHEPKIIVLGPIMLFTKPTLHNFPHLPALVAQALGYINSGEGRIVLAQNRLVLPPFFWLNNLFRETSPGQLFLRMAESVAGAGFGIFLIGFMALAGGGWAELLLSYPWAKFARASQLRQDLFAAELGYADQLIAYLDAYAVMLDVGLPYALFPKTNDTEPRIDALMKWKLAQQKKAVKPAVLARQPQQAQVLPVAQKQPQF